MTPERLTVFMQENGKLETQTRGQIFHSLDFAETLFMLKSGFVKRYQITKEDKRTIELIYGKGHIFPLSQLYTRIFGVEQTPDNLIYVYQAMTDIEVFRVSDDKVLEALQADPLLYQDLFYESGLRMKSHIERMANSILSDEYKKVAHQLATLAGEFGLTLAKNGTHTVKITVPLEPVDIAEQLNISSKVAEAVLASLVRDGYIKIKNNIITISDLHLLKDAYL